MRQPVALLVNPSAGSITEHFDTVTGALIRQGQLEALLVAARGARVRRFREGDSRDQDFHFAGRGSRDHPLPLHDEGFRRVGLNHLPPVLSFLRQQHQQ